MGDYSQGRHYGDGLSIMNRSDWLIFVITKATGNNDRVSWVIGYLMPDADWLKT